MVICGNQFTLTCPFGRGRTALTQTSCFYLVQGRFGGKIGDSGLPHKAACSSGHNNQFMTWTKFWWKASRQHPKELLFVPSSKPMESTQVPGMKNSHPTRRLPALTSKTHGMVDVTLSSGLRYCKSQPRNPIHIFWELFSYGFGSCKNPLHP